MSDTDIYKNREAMPIGNKPPNKRRKRRSTSHRAFDDKSRKRRSKNSGLRRLLHLSRKSDNEKYFWGTMGILIVVVLAVIGIWQFVIMEYIVRSEETKNEYLKYQRSIPEHPGAAQPGPPADSASE
ncbi:hypothetical protein PDESU_05195 [Pontiella desulfatans]|uniref:Uncharacterized protein n=1 Tax=Pontiella desulfatans TaxID=2750659 RepID=A0A6C2UB69_PONDE|nr:hypothetical protein [Pontiella desulfatans]VGO16604.1 hypothetical protein PDESU_05195 [Pontiella desulfatans]